MNSFYDALVNSFVIETLGWTLVHFLWQALLLVSVLSIVGRWCSNLNPRFRYRLFSCGLALIAAMPILTYSFLVCSVDSPTSKNVAEYDSPEFVVENNPTLLPAQVADSQVVAINSKATTSATPVFQSTSGWAKQSLTPWLPVLVLVWGFGVLFHWGRVSAGLVRVRRWRRVSEEIEDPTLLRRFEKLKNRMVVDRAEIRQTHELRVSVVIGIWRPVVLIPVTMMSGMNIRELELILAHELAHVKRNDYLLNVLQKLIESIFFFHPGVWWLSRRISEEREHCCDDLAIATCGDRITLAKALTTMESLRCADSLVAVGANSGPLAKRIKRLLHEKHEIDNSNWPATLLAFLVFCASMALVPTDWLAQTNAENSWSSNLSNPPATAPSQPLSVDDDSDEKGNHQELAIQETVKVDSKTGVKQHVFENIRLTTKSKEQRNETGLDMKYSNVIPYTFVPEKIAKSLHARKLGEIDFEKYRHVKSQDVVMSFIPNDFMNPTGYRLGDRWHRFVDFVRDSNRDQPIVPYLNDQLWATDHLGFYGMNQSRQTKFDVVRIDEVDLGLGNKFGPVNALVLKDENSDFGLLGSKWCAKVRGANGERLWHAATGKFFLSSEPSVEKKHRNEKASSRNRTDASGNQEEKPEPSRPEFMVVEAAKHLEVQSIDVGRSATELLKHFSMVIERHGSPERVQSITNMESIASAFPTKRFHDFFESEEVIFNLPEGSHSRAAFVGEKVEVRETDEGTIVTVTNGELQWIDSVGVPRAVAKPDGGAELLVVSTSIENNEIVMKMKAKRIRPDSEYPNPPVQVKTNPNSGVENEEQPPHRSVRYEIFDGSQEENKPLRLKMKWRYDMFRLAKEAEQESGKSWEAIIYGDNSEKDETGQGINKADDGHNENPQSDERDPKKPWQVAGKVVDEQGRPMSNVSVSAFCGVGSLRMTGQGKTDSSGRFDFRFGPGIWSSNRKMVQAATISVHLDGYVEKNLHRQGNLVAAYEQPDEIGWGGMTEKQLFLPGKQIELSFVMVKSVAVQGVIVDSNGVPQEGFKVSLRGQDMPPSQSGAAFATTDEQGRYELSNVPPGYRYQVLVKPKERGSPWLAWASGPIAFFPGETNEIRFSLNDEGVERIFCCQSMSFRLKGKGQNWKTSLKTALAQDLRSQWEGLSTGEVVKSGTAWANLGE